jgi:hypothetical protein
MHYDALEHTRDALGGVSHPGLARKGPLWREISGQYYSKVTTGSYGSALMNAWLSWMKHKSFAASRLTSFATRPHNTRSSVDAPGTGR